MKTYRRLTLAALAAAGIALAACSGGQQPQEKTLTSEPPEMPTERAAEFAKLLSESNPDAIAAMLTSGARLFPPNSPVVDGPAAIVEYYKGAVSKHLTWQLAVENRVMLGHVALAEGNYRVTSTATGSEIEAGKWLSVWGYQDGAWKVARLIVSPNYDALAAAEAAAAAPAPAAK